MVRRALPKPSRSQPVDASQISPEHSLMPRSRKSYISVSCVEIFDIVPLENVQVALAGLHWLRTP